MTITSIHTLGDKTSSNIVLGDIEAFAAIRMWFDECKSGLSRKEAENFLFRSYEENYAPVIPPINESAKRNILDSVVLYGKLDVKAGKYLFYRSFQDKGVPFSWGEIFGELLGNPLSHSPFSSDLTSGGVGVVGNSFIPSRTHEKLLSSSLLNSLDIAGIHKPRLRSEVTEFLERRFDYPELREGGMISDLYHSQISSIQRSIDLELPLYSSNLVAPVWKRDDQTNTSFQIIEAVWDEVEWLPSPSSYAEAISMSEDERVESLRRSVDVWRHKLLTGDIEDLRDIREIVRNDVKAFKGKSWASGVSRFVTYVALPIGIAEAALNSSYTGLGLTVAGTAAQSISDLIDRQKAKSWLSMGSGYITRK